MAARPVVIAVVLGLILVWALAGPAAAHAIVESVEPAEGATVDQPPERVIMRFSEPVELAFGAIRVFDADGRRVDAGEATHMPGEPGAVTVDLRPGLADGTYTVSWRVISADSHPVSEAYLFHVGAPGSDPEGVLAQVLSGEAGAGPVASWLLSATRWVTLASLVVLVGAAVFMLVVWRPAGVMPTVVGTRFHARWRRAIVVSAGALAGSTIASLVLQGAVAGGTRLVDALSPGVIADVLATRFGRVAAARVLLLVLLAALWWWADLPGVLRRPQPASVGAAGTAPRRFRAGLSATVAGLIVLLATPGLAGHAGTTPPLAWNLAVDTVHVAAAAAWLGGLTLLLWGVFPATAGEAPAERSALLAAPVARFSRLALLAVAVLVLTGIARAWVEVGAIRALTTGYGLLLVAKVGVLAPLLALGAVNHFWVRPRLAAAEGPRAVRVLRRTVTTEAVLGVVVLVLTALLVGLPPARVAAGLDGPAIREVVVGTLEVEVIVDPNTVGQNVVHVTARTAQGQAADIQAVQVLFRMPDKQIGPLVGEGRQLGPGHFVVQGRELSVPGAWVLEIVAHVDEFTDERATVEITVNE